MLIYIVAFSTLLSIFFTAYTLYDSYQSDREFIVDEVEAIEEYAKPALSNAMWRFNYNAIQILLESFAKSQQVSRIELANTEGKVLFEAGIQQPTTEKIRNTDLFTPEKVDGLPPKNIGNLRMYVNEEVLLVKLKDRFLSVFLAQTAKAFLVSIFILLVLHELVSKHLSYLVGQLKNNSGTAHSSAGAEPLVLNRVPVKDELHWLTEAINHYRADQARSVQTLSQQNANLNTALSKLERLTRDKDYQNELINSLFNSMQQYIFLVDKEFHVQRINQAVIERYPNAEDSFIGPSLFEICRVSLIQEEGVAQLNLKNALSADQHKSFSAYCSIDSEERFPAQIDSIPLRRRDTDSQASLAIIILNETDAQRIKKIHYHATHDHLTSLLNRFEFDNLMDKLFSADSEYSEQEYTAGFVDIDNFKTINDLFGHQTGDQVIIKISQVLASNLGEDAWVARQGGDEFIFACPDSLTDTQKKIEKILEEISEHRFKYNGESFRTTVSIGLTKMFPDRDTVNGVVAKIDKAMYRAKGSGGNQVEVFDSTTTPDPIATQTDKYRIVSSIRRSIKAGKLRLYAQEITPLDRHSDLPVRKEILTRFDDVNNRFPSNYIQALESSQQTHLLDIAVLNRFTTDLYVSEIENQHLNINISPSSLTNRNVFMAISAMLEASRSKSTSICIEITEHAISQHPDSVAELSTMIKSFGGLIAIDDFGEGYASYGLIQQFDFDFIKIDGSLVRNVDVSDKTLAIVQSIQSIADSIGALTIAEMTNSERQLELLRDIGIDYSQSNLFHKPTPFPTNGSSARTPEPSTNLS